MNRKVGGGIEVNSRLFRNPVGRRTLLYVLRDLPRFSHNVTRVSDWPSLPYLFLGFRLA